jgi:hypothetical protein
VNADAVRLEINLAREALNRAALALEGAPPEKIVTVRAGESLQYALDGGGTIHLEAGATWEGRFILRRNTALVGAAFLHGTGGPALALEPAAVGVSVDGLTLTSDYSAVVDLGSNEAVQGALEDVPSNIIFRRVKVPTHRGRRAFAIHASQVLLEDCQVDDVYDPGQGDSQAIWIMNTPGDIQITGGSYSAGSEVIILGGDSPKIPGLIPKNVIVDGAELWRPLSWQTDGVIRVVKNIFEAKIGHDLTIRHCKLHGCWDDPKGQEGEGFMLTPTRTGDVQRVTIENNEIWDVGGGINIIGRSDRYVTPATTSGIFASGNTWNISRALRGGRGQWVIAGGEPGTIRLEDNTVVCDGTSTIYYYPGKVMRPDGSIAPGGKIERLEVIGNRVTLGKYGFNLGGVPNAVRWQESVGELVVTDNQFVGPATMAKAFPNNRYAGA